MKLKTLVEEWKDTLKWGNFSVEIFVNPTKKEIVKLGDQIRWAVKGKKMLVWNGEKILHHELLPKYTKYKTFWDSGGWVTGTCEKRKHGEGWFTWSDLFTALKENDIGNLIKTSLGKDYRWINKYFPEVYKFIKEEEETITEEFKDIYKIYPSMKYDKPKQIEVWVNPTYKEMMEVGGKQKRLRWVADNKNKKLYIWDAFKSTHTPKLIKQFGMDGGYENYRQLSGTYDVKYKKMGSDMLYSILTYSNDKKIKKFKKLDWKWADKYIPEFSKFIKTAKKEDL